MSSAGFSSVKHWFSRFPPDFFFGALVSFLSIMGIAYSLSQPWARFLSGEIGAGIFPMFALITLTISGGYLMLRSRRSASSTQINTQEKTLPALGLFIIVFSAAVYSYIAIRLGICVSTMLYVTPFFYILERPKSVRKKIQILASAFLLSLGVYFLTVRVIGLYIPDQLLF